MRLLFHVKNLNYLGGIERSIITRCNMLVARGHEVYILCNVPYDRKAFTVEQIDSRIKVVDYFDLMHISVPDLSSKWKWLVGKVKFLHAISRFIAQVRPDVMVSRHDISLREFFLVPHHGAKYVAEWSTTIDREEVPYKYNRRFWFKWMSWNVDKYLFLVKHDLKLFPGPKNKAVVIPTAVNPSSVCSPLTSKVVVSTGRLAPIKNFAALITSWSQVAPQHPDWQLHIYGEGPERNRLQQLIDELGLGQQVFLKGKTNDVPSALLNASIYAQTTKGEGFSNSILEAIAHGLPIVVTSTHCTEELMTDCEVGFLHPQGDVSGIAKSINYLIENEEARRRMGVNAHKRSYDYAYEKIVDQHEALYHRLTTPGSNDDD